VSIIERNGKGQGAMKVWQKWPTNEACGVNMVKHSVLVMM
jgi:hypothetical protein